MKRENAKYIIRQVPEEQADFTTYFDCDCFTEKSGDYCNTLFIIQRDYGRVSGINSAEYERIENELCDLITDFDWVKDKGRDYDGRPITYKKVMLDHGIKYSPAMCHKLKLFHESIPEFWKPEAIAEYLTIKTGKKWELTSSRGYCQGDYVEIIFCSDVYSEKEAETAGDIYLGAASEYCLIPLDENGEEIETETCYGFIVSDWQTDHENIKKTLCELTDTNPDEVIVQIISDTTSRVVYEHEYEEV